MCVGFWALLFALTIQSWEAYLLSSVTPGLAATTGTLRMISASVTGEEEHSVAGGLLESEHPRWQQMWTDGIRAGQKFDTAACSPALVQLIEQGDIPLGRSLVPGCGRGYDLVALHSEDRHALGVDIAEAGIEAANEYLESQSSLCPLLKSQAAAECVNFFDLPVQSAADLFDFVYDYTFLCALDPSIRHLWAQKMADLVKPGGELLTLIFPIGTRSGGPPFAVSLALMEELLLPVGFTCKQLEMLPPELCQPGRGNAESDVDKSGIGRWIRD